MDVSAMNFVYLSCGLHVLALQMMTDILYQRLGLSMSVQTATCDLGARKRAAFSRGMMLAVIHHGVAQPFPPSPLLHTICMLLMQYKSPLSEIY